MKSGDNNLDAHRETKTVRDVLSPYPHGFRQVSRHLIALANSAKGHYGRPLA